ncbi:MULTISPECIES: DMT family transporter [Anaeromyxobacter]|uniref:DMT family transporter n=1 Tax=Anaeromyxobacter TaxID=161492 RepID=UPI001F571567|nr:MULTISPECIES: EamA family transporter [unclassified Anaeromyxobacter]
MAVTRPDRHGAAQLGAALAVLSAAALFGTTGTAQALGPGGTTPLGVGAVRLAIGAVVLAAVALAGGSARRPRWRSHAAALAIGGVAVAAYQLAWFAGLRRTGVTLGTIVGIGSGPVFAGLFHLTRRAGALSRAWVLGTGLTVAGAALLAAHGAADGAPPDAVGLCLMLGAGLSYAVYAQAAKHAMDAGLHPAQAMAGVFGVGALLMAPLLSREPMAWLASPRGSAMALHLGVLTVGLAYWLYGKGLRRLAVPTVVTLTLAEPLTAAVLGVGVLGERLGPMGWVGAAAIALGLAVAGRGDRARVTEALPA